MKKIILKSLKIRNFKGIGSMDVDFSSDVTSVFGSNATGKTTIFDAFTWLLFDKDSAGRSDFNIKPLSPSGDVADHAAITSVEGVIELDGVETVYKKTLCEKWSKRRGSENPVYDGNETERFINDLPMKKYAYDEAIRDIADENVFRAVTSVTYFSQTLSKNDRRKLLFEMSSAATDRELIGADTRFTLLLPLLDKFGSIDNIKLVKDRERRTYNEKRGGIPVRIDELKQQAEKIAGIDFAEIEKKHAEAAANVERAKEKIISIKNFSYPNELSNKITAIENDIRALQLENREYIAAHTVQTDNSKLEAEIITEQNRIEQLHVEHSQINAEIERLRNKFKEIQARPIKLDEVCPTCGRAYDAESIEAARNATMNERDKQLAEINLNGQKLKERLDKTREELDAATAKHDSLNNELASIPNPKPAGDMPGYTERMQSLTAELEDKRIQKMDTEKGFAEMLTKAESELKKLTDDEKQLAAELSKRGIIDENNRRIEELNEQARSIAKAIEDTEQILDIIDEFTRFKVSAIEESINGLFESVCFKLFDVQVNGALAECCEATVNGVPYTDLNSAAKVNAGLDIINAVSRHYGISAPIFIDNAESVVDFIGANSQVIRLVVSETDERMRVA